ncbi:MAG TPA: peptidylprolyl isomerase [Prolixibacteraceae bacterium]|nr:peptidylprolyl isomerase [Prolixibacteraceae bacterium]
MQKHICIIAFLLAINFLSFNTFGQDKTVDHIVAIIGSNIILKSEVETAHLQNQAQGITSEGDMKCDILENMLVEKLLVAEAELDTNIIVTDNQVNQQLDMRIQYFMQHLGSEKEVENYFKKPIIQLKADLHDIIHDEILSEQMRSTIIKNLKVTPSEVRYYFRNLPQDQIPKVNTQYEYAQITLVPAISDDEENRIKDELRGIKKRVDDGENFSMFAVLYSECPSSREGGDLGFFGRAAMDPEFSAVAFNLKPGQVSNVVRSEFGYHIIQMMDRRGDQIRCKHILMKPKINIDTKQKSIEIMDSLVTAIRKDKIAFNDAAIRYSHDKSSRNNGGTVVNPATMSSKFEPSTLKPNVSKILSNLKIGEISDPFIAINDKDREVVTTVKLINKIVAHQANISEDYPLLSEIFQKKKQEDTIMEWVSEKQSKTYIRIDETYQNCDFRFANWIK